MDGTNLKFNVFYISYFFWKTVSRANLDHYLGAELKNI